MTLRDQIAEQALTLPPEDREYVADRLERSLPMSDFASVELADAWSREIDRRIAAWDRGETRSVDFEIALDNVRQALLAIRSNKAASGEV